MLSTNFGSSNPLLTTSKQIDKKKSDLYRAPYSELTLSLPFGIFRNNLTNSGGRTRNRKRKTVKNKTETDNDDTV